MSVTLGLNAFHPDSSASLMIDGEIVAAVSQERLGERKKHTSDFPIDAIRYVLGEAKINLSDVTEVAIASDPKANLIRKALYGLKNPTNGISGFKGLLSKVKNQRQSVGDLAGLLGLPTRDNKYILHRVEHHVAHIASSYYCSGFNEPVLGLSLDGSGDFVSGLAAICDEGAITPISKSYVPNSLGYFYTALCQFIGFDRFGEEYKVMGLAPYGDMSLVTTLRQLIISQQTGWFKLNSNFFDVAKGYRETKIVGDGEIKLGSLYTDQLVDLLGRPRERDAEITQREKNIARAVQVIFEEKAIEIFKKFKKISGAQKLVYAGGCALNGVLNAKVREQHIFDDVYIQCAAADDGLSLGAALYAHNKNVDYKPNVMSVAHWGPQYGSNRIEAALKQYGLNATNHENDEDLVEVAADAISRGEVVGWYQGRSEWGPRALGNRSILANPTILDMKAIINAKIKKRESFRPFAPSVLEEDVSEYFASDIRSPFMMHVVPFKEHYKKLFPAVAHVDGTGRLQSVSQKNNPLYHALISELKKRTGYGIVLNTSFNENEPVVDTPEQAIECFLRTDMDSLFLGRYHVTK